MVYIKIIVIILLIAGITIGAVLGMPLIHCNASETANYQDALPTMITDAIIHGHKWDNGTVLREATCESDGVMIYHCTYEGCDATLESSDELPALSHHWDEGIVITPPTCTTPGEMLFTCLVGGETRTEIIPLIEHDWDEGKITLEPTSSSYGIKTFTCKVCGRTSAETVPELQY